MTLEVPRPEYARSPYRCARCVQASRGTVRIRAPAFRRQRTRPSAYRSSFPVRIPGTGSSPLNVPHGGPARPGQQ